MHSVQEVLVLMFSGVNGCFFIPAICKSIDNLYQKKIDETHFFRRVILFGVILIILLALECGYMKTNTKRHIRNNVQQPIKTKERTLIVLIKIFLRSASLLLSKS